MATSDDTRVKTRLEQTIDAERANLLKAHAVQKCLYEVLLYADGEDAVTYAEAAHVVATLIAESLDKLDSIRIRPLIEEAKRGRPYELPEEKLDSGPPGGKVEDVRPVYRN